MEKEPARGMTEINPLSKLVPLISPTTVLSEKGQSGDSGLERGVDTR